MNRTMITGRLTRDIELKRTNSGLAFCYFTIATRKANRNLQDDDFINCCAWEKTAELMAKYLKKGSKIGIEGRNQSRSYEKNGQRVYVQEVYVDRVEFLDKKENPILEEKIQEASHEVEYFDKKDYGMSDYEAERPEDYPF